MYLTKDEFSVLCGLKFLLTDRDMKEKFKLTESVIKKNKINLCRKYGCNEVLKTADFNKIEVFEENKIPYYEYENSVLVKKIKIKKSEAAKLADVLHTLPANKDYELIYDESSCGLNRNLDIKETDTGKKYEVFSEILD